jgi:hypothetical protein
MAKGGIPPYPTEDVMRRGILGVVEVETQEEVASQDVKMEVVDIRSFRLLFRFP